MTSAPSRPMPAWDPALDDVFVCTAVRAVAPDVATIVLAPRGGGTVSFRAGQYVTAEFLIDGRDVPRCYTIASPPTRPERLAITVKRSAAGTVSPWLHDGGLTVGSTMRIGEPQGDFTLEAHPAPTYLFLTAGTGITPALSVLREAYDLGSELDLVLVHSQRRPTDVPYRHELDAIVSMLPGVRMHQIFSAGEAGTATRLGVEALTALVPDTAAREVFICGPDGYRATARAAALDVGVPADRIHEETFTLETGAAPVGAVTPDTTDGYRIEFRDHGVAVHCGSGTTVLDAATAAGLTLPFSCTQGLCGTCKSTLVAGEVDMQHAGGIRPREVAAGRILLCCSRPTSDLVISA